MCLRSPPSLRRCAAREIPRAVHRVAYVPVVHSRALGCSRERSLVATFRSARSVGLAKEVAVARVWLLSCSSLALRSTAAPGRGRGRAGTGFARAVASSRFGALLRWASARNPWRPKLRLRSALTRQWSGQPTAGHDFSLRHRLRRRRLPLTSSVSPFMFESACIGGPCSAFPARVSARFGCAAFYGARNALQLATVQPSAVPPPLLGCRPPVPHRSGMTSEPTSVFRRKGLAVLGRSCSSHRCARVAELPPLAFCFSSTVGALSARANPAVERTRNGGSRLACSPTGGGAVARRSPLR